MGIEPQTAFTLWPWWPHKQALRDDTLLAGWNMPAYLLNADWSAYGQIFTVAGMLAPTGTLLDNTMLMTLPAAQKLAQARRARGSTATSEQSAEISAVLLRTSTGDDVQAIVGQVVRLDPQLDVQPAPAYVLTLRRQVRQAQSLVQMLCGLTLCLALWCAARIYRDGR